MPANTQQSENELIDWSVSWLRQRLPTAWSIERSQRQPAEDAGRAGAVIKVQAPNVYATLTVEAKRSVAPRDVEALLGRVGRQLRALAPHVGILVVAPWLSARTRELLSDEDMNYLDQTGNASIRLENPAVFIRTEGSTRDPAPGPRAKANVRGPKAARLIRALVDVCPPYGVRELAAAAGVAPGYVSRLLDALDHEALIARSRRGRVEETDVSRLLRRWADTYDVFKANSVSAFIAPTRAPGAMAALADARASAQTAITGSFAAVRFAPVAAPTLLAVYSDNPDRLARELDLLPADHGANVVLLSPFDPVVWERTQEREGVRYVAASQAAVDCLTGTGRMPAEGEALVAWMVDNEQAWRANSLADVTGERGA